MKRGGAIFCALVLIAGVLFGCARETASSGYIKADAMPDPYGGVSDDKLRSSGAVTLYWDTLEQSDQERDFADYFQKYYDGTVTLRFCPYEDEAATLLRDRAASDVPDVIRMTAGYWPRAALRGLTYHTAQLEQLGVAGLDHPALEKYRDMTEAAYSYNGACYALSIESASPAMVAVNRDLFNSYPIRTPESYEKEGLWTPDAMLRCCYELVRTLPDGSQVYGVCVRDPLWFLQANDADPIRFRETTLTSGLTSTRALHALALCRNLFGGATATDDADAFVSGSAGMLCGTADELVPLLTQCAFDWDILPFPYGSENVSGARPGKVTGWGIPVGSRNVQGAVNFVLARQLFTDFYYNTDRGALWNAAYTRYSEKQRACILEAVGQVRPACYPHIGTLPDGDTALWQAVRGEEPIYDVAQRFSARITEQIREEMTQQALEWIEPSR